MSRSEGGSGGGTGAWLRQPADRRPHECMRKIVPGGAIQAVSHASLPRDRIFNRGALTIGAGPLPRKQRCAGDGASATARVNFAGRSAQGPGGRPGAGGALGDAGVERPRAPVAPPRARGATGGCTYWKVRASADGRRARDAPGLPGARVADGLCGAAATTARRTARARLRRESAFADPTQAKSQNGSTDTSPRVYVRGM